MSKRLLAATAAALAITSGATHALAQNVPRPPEHPGRFGRNEGLPTIRQADSHSRWHSARAQNANMEKTTISHQKVVFGFPISSLINQSAHGVPIKKTLTNPNMSNGCCRVLAG